MICNNCGKEISNESKFCRFCGNQFESESGTINFATLEDAETIQKKLEKKRNISIGILLIVFSLLGLLATIPSYFNTTSEVNKLSESPLPYIIDLGLATQILRQESKYLNWIYWRAILGLLIWGFLAISQQKWGEVILQLIYSFYFIFLIKFKLSSSNLRIANFIILPLIILGLIIVVLTGEY